MKTVYGLIIWTIVVFAIGWVCGATLWSELPQKPILMDIVQTQKYLNECIAQDPWIAPELLEVDGIIGPATIKAWERASAMEVEL